jgi:hypothetical protein
MSAGDRSVLPCRRCAVASSAMSRRRATTSGGARQSACAVLSAVSRAMEASGWGCARSSWLALRTMTSAAPSATGLMRVVQSGQASLLATRPNRGAISFVQRLPLQGRATATRESPVRTATRAQACEPSLAGLAGFGGLAGCRGRKPSAPRVRAAVCMTSTTQPPSPHDGPQRLQALPALGSYQSQLGQVRAHGIDQLCALARPLPSIFRRRVNSCAAARSSCRRRASSTTRR